jgi:hypothetical protein
MLNIDTNQTEFEVNRQWTQKAEHQFQEFIDENIASKK